MARNPYLKIKQNQIMTATPGELTLMLYDGAIKFANQAMIAINDGDIERAHKLIIKVQNIIREFQITLDDSYDVSIDLAIMYDFVYNKLIEANVKKDPEKLEEALYIIRELRNTWKEVLHLAKNTEHSRMRRKIAL